VFHQLRSPTRLTWVKADDPKLSTRNRDACTM